MKEYDHKKIESMWQKKWEKTGIYYAQNKSKKPKYYSLIEFPYPSGDGLHVGHPRPYIGMDVISRKRRMEGFNVLYPIGWDAFGLPTENYAIKSGLDPRVVTKKNSDTFRRQIKSLGISFDWSREINTTDPKYYKWTQWIFLRFLKKGLAYKAKMMINWCPKDKIGLANEEVINGRCERCGTAVSKREKEQWLLAITKYADRLYRDLDNVDYLPQIKLSQRNWIGRSEGAEIEFKLVSISGQADSKHSVKVFTTRPDTIFGVTFIAVSAELAKTWLEVGWQASDEIKKYINKTLEERLKSGFDREKIQQEKTGISASINAINPANKEKIPAWIVNYVLPDVGTGAIMGVPAHDERDFEFAKKFKLPIRYVVEPKFVGTSSEGTPRPDLPYVKREAVCAIVRNPKDDTYLCISWKNFLMHGLVTGGMEFGEDIVETARREVLEETGYKDLKLIKVSPVLINTFFYHRQKKENRHAHFRFVFFELQNEEQDPISEEESNRHEILWKKKGELKDFFTVFEGDFVVRLLNSSDYVFTGEGIAVNSGKFNDLDSENAKKEIIKFVGGKEKVTFKLRDWIFSRQRYWGEPIPVINCPKCGLVPVPESDLPVALPKIKNYHPTESGESPLANVSKWVNVKCPKCKGKAKRETDTMPNWAGSSWYYLRYTDPENSKEFASHKNLKYWTPVDWYNGGNEHTTLHLLYSRFWHKFLFDLKLVPSSEPYMKRTSHGLILAEGGEKMSKSKGNVVNPDDIVKTYGADTLRIYEMFMGPFDQSVSWSTDSIIGARRFIEKVWRIGVKATEKDLEWSGRGGGPRGTEDLINSSTTPKLTKLLHKTIKKVSEDIEEMRFNTAISSMMILATEMEKAEKLTAESYKLFLQILSPFAPHVTEELWATLGEKRSISHSTWPSWDERLIRDEETKIVVQINGKVRAEILVPRDAPEEEVKEKALKQETVLRHISGKEVKKVIYVQNKLINIVL
ncbi:MAG TPA: class I tRNA ligase family protein [Candidatus Paceibacterota bacterium]|nr:class I tRNA ligase family protein [Candidatus Paceibacterota bacterium]